jgi:hypothetical protein
MKLIDEPQLAIKSEPSVQNYTPTNLEPIFKDKALAQ